MWSWRAWILCCLLRPGKPGATESSVPIVMRLASSLGCESTGQHSSFHWTRVWSSGKLLLVTSHMTLWALTHHGCERSLWEMQGLVGSNANNLSIWHSLFFKLKRREYDCILIYKKHNPQVVRNNDFHVHIKWVLFNLLMRQIEWTAVSKRIYIVRKGILKKGSYARYKTGYCSIGQ